MIIGLFTIQHAQDSRQCNSCLIRYENSNNVGTLITGFSNYILSFVMSCYILIAIYSVWFASRRLKRPGVSKDIREMFLYKHQIYVFVFLVIWVIQLSQNYYELFNPVFVSQSKPSSQESFF
jgi:hypothetical protein